MHGVFDLSDPVPVGGAGIHLGSGTAVDGHSGNPCLLHGFGKFHAVDTALIPAKTHFHRHRTAGATDDRFGYLDGKVGGAHEAGPVTAVGDFRDGTAHIDVDDIRAGDLTGDGGGLLHADRVTAENLGGGGVLILP